MVAPDQVLQWVKNNPGVVVVLTIALLPGLLAAAAFWSFVLVVAAPVLLPGGAAILAFLVIVFLRLVFANWALHASLNGVVHGFVMLEVVLSSSTSQRMSRNPTCWAVHCKSLFIQNQNSCITVDVGMWLFLQGYKYFSKKTAGAAAQASRGMCTTKDAVFPLPEV